MRIAVAKEVREGERRVALIPDLSAQLVKAGHEVWIETGAGLEASYPDTAYEAAGATIITDDEQLWRDADVLLKVGVPTERCGYPEAERLRPGAVLIGFLNPLSHVSMIQQLASGQITAFSMEWIPRLSRAQSMDALSSQAIVMGYKGALLAADALGKFLPMLTTAAGTVAPAKVLVIGAGVAGLMAIATARRLGAVVEAFDIRPAVREEVQSLGAAFVDVELDEETATEGGYAQDVSAASRQREQDVLHDHIQRADIVITTALVPGKRAPLLVTESMVTGMQPGSVIMDLAAEQGGNCACTEVGKTVSWHGVTILGPCHVPSLMPAPASQMYAKNMMALLQHLISDGELRLDFEDEITHSACVTHAGEVRHEQMRQALLESRVSEDEQEGTSI